MAFISQEKKKELAPRIKSVLKKYGMKGSIAIKHHSNLVVNIREGVLDLVDSERGYRQVNTYWVTRNEREAGNETVANFFEELLEAMRGKNTGWYDESDISTDYFHTAWYNDINVGKWDKPYVHVK